MPGHKVQALPKLSLIAATLALTLAVIEGIAWVSANIFLPSPPSNSPASAGMLVPDNETVFRYKPDYTFTYSLEGHTVVARTNALGLADDEWTDERTAIPHRMIALGDSFTFGWGVSDKARWWRQLEMRLNGGSRRDWAVFGIGHWMAAFDQNLLFLKRYWETVRPELVVQAVYPGHAITIMPHSFKMDANGSINGIIDPIHFVDGNGNLASGFHGEPFKTPVHFPYSITLLRRLFNEVRFNLKYRDIVSRTGSMSYIDPYDPKSQAAMAEAWSKTFISIKQTAEFVHSKGARYALAIIPFREQVAVAAALSNVTENGFTFSSAPSSTSVGRTLAFSALAPDSGAYQYHWLTKDGGEEWTTFNQWTEEGAFHFVPTHPGWWAFQVDVRRAGEIAPFIRHNIGQVRVTSESISEGSYPQNLFREFCEHNDIYCIDALDDFRHRADAGSLYFLTDFHWTEAGHAFFAELIAQRLGKSF